MVGPETPRHMSVTLIWYLDLLVVWCLCGMWETGVKFPIEAQNLFRLLQCYSLIFINYSSLIQPTVTFGGQCKSLSLKHMKTCFPLLGVSLMAVRCLYGLMVWCEPRMQQTGIQYLIEAQIVNSHYINPLSHELVTHCILIKSTCTKNEYSKMMDEINIRTHQIKCSEVRRQNSVLSQIEK